MGITHKQVQFHIKGKHKTFTRKHFDDGKMSTHKSKTIDEHKLQPTILMSDSMRHKDVINLSG